MCIYSHIIELNYTSVYEFHLNSKTLMLKLNQNFLLFIRVHQNQKYLIIFWILYLIKNIIYFFGYCDQRFLNIHKQISLYGLQNLVNWYISTGHCHYVVQPLWIQPSICISEQKATNITLTCLHSQLVHSDKCTRHDMIGIIYDNQACIIQNIAKKFGNEMFVQKCATH